MDKDKEIIEEKEIIEKQETTKKAAKATPKSTPKKTTKKTTEEVIEKITKPTIKATRPQRDVNELVQVICITNTPLTYESKSQIGYRVEWDGFLQENWMEYKELINMRNSQRAFFEEPWIICDWDVLVDLKVDQYYKNIIDLEHLEGLFEKSPEELEKTLKVVPNGIKTLIVDKAFELRREKRLDSISIIETIEKTLKIDLSV